jgi:hypothetical protein
MLGTRLEMRIRKIYRKLLRFDCRTGRFEDEPIDKGSAKVVDAVVVGSGVAISGVTGRRDLRRVCRGGKGREKTYDFTHIEGDWILDLKCCVWVGMQWW